MGYRKQLSFRTDCLNIMHNIPKRRATKIDREILESAQYKIRQAKTLKEKQEIVKQTNPFIYVFGKTRKVFKPYLTYEENFDGT